MKKKVKINYLAKDIERSQSGEFIETKWLSELVEGRSTKRYHNSIGLLVQLSKCARLLLDFLVEIMDEDNYVNNNNLLKNEFNTILKKTGQGKYGSITINKAFTELANLEILFKDYRKKGNYQISPLFFFNGSEKDREKLIRKNLEKAVKGAANYRRKKLYEKRTSNEDE